MYKMNILEQITQEQIRTDLPKFNIGDTIRIYVKIIEGTRERIQMFEGTVIKKNHGGIQETFTVRRVSYGVGVERTFPMNSPKIDKIEVTRRGKVRRAKLYYLRDRVGKAAKTKEQIGARIEDREIVVKEDLTEEPVVETEETPVEAAPEEAPAVETENVTVEETVDTVKEEVVEDVKEEPAVEEVKEEVKAEETKKEEKEDKKAE